MYNHIISFYNLNYLIFIVSFSVQISLKLIQSSIQDLLLLDFTLHKCCTANNSLLLSDN